MQLGVCLARLSWLVPSAAHTCQNPCSCPPHSLARFSRVHTTFSFLTCAVHVHSQSHASSLSHLSSFVYWHCLCGNECARVYRRSERVRGRSHARMMKKRRQTSCRVEMNDLHCVYSLDWRHVSVYVSEANASHHCHHRHHHHHYCERHEDARYLKCGWYLYDWRADAMRRWMMKTTKMRVRRHVDEVWEQETRRLHLLWSRVSVPM